jgi:hypothetical protein
VEVPGLFVSRAWMVGAATLSFSWFRSCCRESEIKKAPEPLWVRGPLFEGFRLQSAAAPGLTSPRTGMKIETTPTSPPDRRPPSAAKATCGGYALVIAPESCSQPERTSSFGATEPTISAWCDVTSDTVNGISLVNVRKPIEIGGAVPFGPLQRLYRASELAV